MAFDPVKLRQFADELRTDLIDLWIEGRLPIKSVLMVTHNIEEAVMMADRVLIFSSNPGRVRAELPITLPRPRDPLSVEFLDYQKQLLRELGQQTEAAA